MEVTIKEEDYVISEISSNDKASEYIHKNITDEDGNGGFLKTDASAETKPLNVIQNPSMEPTEKLDQNSMMNCNKELIKIELPVTEELAVKVEEDVILSTIEERRRKKAQYKQEYYLKRKTELNQRRQGNCIKQRQNRQMDLIHGKDEKLRKRAKYKHEYLKRKADLNQRRQANHIKQRHIRAMDLMQRRKRTQYKHDYYLKRKAELNKRRRANRIKQLQNRPMELTHNEDQRRNRTQYTHHYYLNRKMKERRKANLKKLQQNQQKNPQSLHEHYCGQLIHKCTFCTALHFEEEQVGSDGHFIECCYNGKIRLSDSRRIKGTPLFLLNYFRDNTDDAINFRENILAYNSALAFASLDVNIAPQIPGADPYTLKIRGQMSKCVDNLYSSPSQNPCFGQLYVLDPKEALEQRMGRTENQGCFVEVMKNLQTFLVANNPYARAFKTIAEIEKEQTVSCEAKGIQVPNFKVVFTKGSEKKKYPSTTKEIAAVFVGPAEEVPSNVDFIIHLRNEPMLTLPLASPNVDPMIYPLLFPYGEKGWEDKLLPSSSSHGRNDYVTLLQYYSYRLAIRPGFSVIHSAGKLFQQYIVDAFLKVESSRLQWTEQNQYALNMQNCKILSDHITTKASEAPLKKLVILPSTFVGGPRNIRQNYLDALTIFIQYGKPDYFIKFACNPKWREITENMKSWEEVQHRPDLVARVFSLKLKELLRDLLEKHVFGVVVAHVYVIKFQETGLPCAHILLTVRNQDRLRSGAQIDKVISAEIPDNNWHLYNIVKTHMVHGPCGLTHQKSPCMFKGECTEDYPKVLCSETIKDGNGHVQYRRRNNIAVSINNFDLDDRWVVPYNPYLSLKYNAHVNVESCAGFESVKCLFKDTNKRRWCALCSKERTVRKNKKKKNNRGHDCIDREISDGNEIENYVNSRYISAPEAAWRLFENKMSGMSHTVYNLAVNLPNEQVYSTENVEETAAQTIDTTLAAWFHLNKTNAKARKYLYTEIPKYFAFTKDGRWNQRERGCESILARMYFVNPTDLERFCLRLLLLRVRGATCYDDLKTREGIKYDTFHEAALAWGLLENHEEWKNCLTEAVFCYMPSQMRLLFSLICTFCRSANMKELWEMFKDSLIEDFTQTYDDDASITLGLCDIQDNLMVHGLKCTDVKLPNPYTNTATLYLIPSSYKVQEEAKCGKQMYENLNAIQAHIVDDVLEAIYGDSANKLFFVDGPGGTGKTYLYSVLLHIVRGKGDTAEAVAWTSIAASLLKGGSTAQSRFTLPDPVLGTSLSTIELPALDAKHLKTVKLFIWDEAPMVPKHALETVDKLLRSITRVDEPFGGKVFVLGGDFRQIAPRGDKCGSVRMCLKNSALWPLFRKKYLIENMRLGENEQVFADFLLKIGNDTFPPEPNLDVDLIKIPEDYVITDSLVDKMYGNILNCKDTALWASTVILCLSNSGCSSINEDVINKLPGKCYDYYSVDSIECDDQSDYELYTTEFLNSLTPADMPPHHLRLKINAVIILLRDLNIQKGLCSGARFIVKRLFTNFIEAEILTGQTSGNVVFLPRITLSPSDNRLPFRLNRRQFPIQLAFAITIDKAQGQTFNKLGIYLPEPVYSHGQLYLAFSRARKGSNVKIKIENTKEQGNFKGTVGTFTKNIVYRELI